MIDFCITDLYKNENNDIEFSDLSDENKIAMFTEIVQDEKVKNLLKYIRTQIFKKQMLNDCDGVCQICVAQGTDGDCIIKSEQDIFESIKKAKSEERERIAKKFSNWMRER